LEKLKIFLIIFAILTTFTHGGRITQKIRSSAIRDDSTFSPNNASVTPYFRQPLDFVTTKASHFDNIPMTFTPGNTLVPEIVEELAVNIPSTSIPSAIIQVKYNEISRSRLSGILSPSILLSHFFSGSNEKYVATSLPLPTKHVMPSIPTSAYSTGLSFVAGTPTTSSPSKLAVALEYMKLFILFFVFCIMIPTLSFVMSILPTVIQFVQLLKSRSADQREVISIDFFSHKFLLISISVDSDTCG
jgi:hypothetical protein